MLVFFFFFPLLYFLLFKEEPDLLPLLPVTVSHGLLEKRGI